MSPKIGQIVSIQHRSKIDKKTELAKIVPAGRFIEQRITNLYMNGKVKVQSGDVWRIVPHGNNQWRTSPMLF